MLAEELAALEEREERQAAAEVVEVVGVIMGKEEARNQGVRIERVSRIEPMSS